MLRVARLTLPFVLAAAILAGGCGGNGGGSGSDCPPAGAGTEARTATAAPGADLTYLTDLTTEAVECGDRVVFEFRDQRSGARVEYLPREQALVEDGSGTTIEAKGNAFLVVRLEPAATAESKGDQLEFTYTGPRRLQPEDAEHVQEIVKTGDFEAVVTWAIGLGEERPFRVETSDRTVSVEID